MQPRPLSYANPLSAPMGGRKLMLAWWAILPVLTFLVLEGAIVRKYAQAHAINPVYTVLRDIVGGLLTALLIAWLAYRIGRRSQLVASITFTVVLSLPCAGVLLESGRVARALAQAMARPPSLAFRSTPLSAFDGTLRINFPAAMQVVGSGNSLDLALYNPVHRNVDFEFVVEILPTVDGITLEELERRLGNAIERTHNLPDAFVWHSVNGPSRRAITKLMRGGAGTNDYVAWALIPLGGARVCTMSFTIASTDPSDRVTYSKIAEQIIASAAIPRVAASGPTQSTKTMP